MEESNEAQTWLDRGLQYEKSNKNQDALDAFNKAISLNSNFFWAWNNKGVILIKLGRYQETLEASEKAISINPNIIDGWFCKGTALQNLNRNQEALEASEKDISINPNHSYAWNNKGVAFEKLCRYQEALEAYDKAISIDSNNTLAKNNREFLLKKKNSLMANNSKTEMGNATKLSGIINNINRTSSTHGSVSTQNNGNVSGSIQTTHTTSFRVDNRPCSWQGTLNISNGDSVTVMGEGSGELNVYVLYNRTTNLIYWTNDPGASAVYIYAIIGVFLLFGCISALSFQLPSFSGIMLLISLFFFGYAWHLNEIRKKIERYKQMVQI